MIIITLLSDSVLLLVNNSFVALYTTPLTFFKGKFQFFVLLTWIKDSSFEYDPHCFFQANFRPAPLQSILGICTSGKIQVLATWKNILIIVYSRQN